MQNIKDQLNTVIKLFNNGEKQKAFEKANLLITRNDKDINFLLLKEVINNYTWNNSDGYWTYI